MYRTAAPVACATCCHGTRLAWCSICVSKISSPARRNLRPHALATRLIDIVVPEVKMISSLRVAPIKSRTLARVVPIPRRYARRTDNRRGSRVGVVPFVALPLLLDHRVRLLGGGRTIEVDERLTVGQRPIEDRKFAPDALASSIQTRSIGTSAKPRRPLEPDATFTAAVPRRPPCRPPGGYDAFACRPAASSAIDRIRRTMPSRPLRRAELSCRFSPKWEKICRISVSRISCADFRNRP